MPRSRDRSARDGTGGSRRAPTAPPRGRRATDPSPGCAADRGVDGTGTGERAYEPPSFAPVVRSFGLRRFVRRTGQCDSTRIQVDSVLPADRRRPVTPEPHDSTGPVRPLWPKAARTRPRRIVHRSAASRFMRLAWFVETARAAVRGEVRLPLQIEACGESREGATTRCLERSKPLLVHHGISGFGICGHRPGYGNMLTVIQWCKQKTARPGTAAGSASEACQATVPSFGLGTWPIWASTPAR